MHTLRRSIGIISVNIQTTSEDLLAKAAGTRFRTILVDPPWRFINRTGKVAPEHLRLARYTTLSTDQICELPIGAMAEDTAHLYLWVDELDKAKANGPVVVPDIAYCEFSIGMPSKAATDEAIQSLALERLPCSDESFFRAGRAYRKYKDENSGMKANVLPDFLIGAQAETAEAPLLTANSKDFLGYFAKLVLVSPA
jgi:predicted nucleic acid-binding protein